MIWQEKKDTEEILNRKKKRLQKLREQQALFGENTPPEISIEIEKIEKEIKELEQKDDPRSKMLTWKWVGIIVAVITLILLFVYRNEVWYLFNGPHPTIASVSYTINSAPTIIATRGEIIELEAGNKLCLTDFKSSSPKESNQKHTIHGEAYIRKGGRAEVDIDYQDGRFTATPPIQAGIQNIGDFRIGPNNEINPCWVVESGWNTIIILLYHNYPYGQALEDRFFLALGVSNAP